MYRIYLEGPLAQTLAAIHMQGKYLCSCVYSVFTVLVSTKPCVFAQYERTGLSHVAVRHISYLSAITIMITNKNPIKLERVFIRWFGI